ncbi:MAG: SCP2 sterol-binding domain-containing protein [Candidatus Hodarchaeales archaeon]|jgi:putative sterol carrier protein
MGTEKIKEFVDAINGRDDVKAKLKNWTKIAGYNVDGEDCYVQHNADGTCEFFDGKPEKANFTMIGTSEIFEKMFTGEEDAQKAYFAKKYKIEGDVMGTMKLIPIIKMMKP